MDVAVEASRQVALRRKQRFTVVAHGGPDGPEFIAGSLMDAIPLEKFAAPRSKAWVVVDAASSMAEQSARTHAEAEARLGMRVAPRLTVVCFYTPAAIAQFPPGKVHRLHSVVAAPGQV